MNMKLSMLGLMVAGLILVTAPAGAHHSFDAEYDANHTADLTGVVTKIDWVNPHAYISFDVSDEHGAVSTFRVELGPPYALIRGGWKRDTVKIGDTITVQNAALAKNGSNAAGATRETFLILASGEKMVMR